MNALRKIFPLSFKMSKSTGAFIAGLVIFLFAPFIIGTLIILPGLIPWIGWILWMPWASWIASVLLPLYGEVSLVLLILDYCKALERPAVNETASGETTAQ